MLNKITPEKFDRLMEQLLELGINSGDALKDVISLIFDKVRVSASRGYACVIPSKPAFLTQTNCAPGYLGAHVLPAVR